MTRVRDFRSSALNVYTSSRLQVAWKTGMFFETRVVLAIVVQHLRRISIGKSPCSPRAGAERSGTSRY